MKVVDAFWDSSALVPLCVSQAATETLQGFYARFSAVVWWATPVEMESALARLARSGTITPVVHAQARLAAEKIALDWSMIEASIAIAMEARELLRVHDLRAADALQLAAALAWCESKPGGEIFLTCDKILGHAAGLAGFTVELILH